MVIPRAFLSLRMFLPVSTMLICGYSMIFLLSQHSMYQSVVYTPKKLYAFSNIKLLLAAKGIYFPAVCKGSDAPQDEAEPS